MVHTGRPSRGCAVCRKRRIKCDEKQPECSYCIKTKQTCPGYKDEFELAWRDQTSIAQKNVERRQRASERRAAADAESRALSRASQSRSARELLATVPRVLTGDPETYAVAFFMSAYANPSISNDERKDFLDYVAPQYINAGPDSVLATATMTLSTFLFVAWLDRPPDTVASRSVYLKAVSTLKERLAQQEGCADNDVLTAVLLLQAYERLLGAVNQSKPGRAHLEGALALIEHRGVENFRDEVGQGLLSAVRSQLIEESFSTSKKLAVDITTWSSHCPGSPSALLDTINVQLANLAASAPKHAALPSYIRASKPNETEALLHQAQNIELQLLQWSAMVPSSWIPIHVSSESIPCTIVAAGVYQDYCHVYPSISVSGSWNKYRIALIRTSLIISSLLTLVPPSYTDAGFSATSLHTASQQTIQQMADDICASIPFTLGDKTRPTAIGDRRIQYPCVPGETVPYRHYQMAPAMGGYWLLAPLQMLMGLGEGEMGLRQGQKRWIGGQLMRIARIYNLGK